MKELLYFSSSDLMVQVLYDKEGNSLNYFTHRKLSFGERVIVEQYLLTNIAVKTEYYKKQPANFNYGGVSGHLVKELNQFHLKNTVKTLKNKDKELDETVKSLIDNSLEKYYFEQIGNTIIEMRKAISEPEHLSEIGAYRNKIKELVAAYNSHSEKVVSYSDVIPKDLRIHFGF